MRRIWDRARLFVAALLLAGTIALQPARAQEQSAPTGDQIVIVASGTGADEASALKQAMSNAIQQAVGTIVDSATVVKDDKIISDQVLTASNAIVSHYDPVGDPKHDGGLVTVKIRAVVQKTQLTDRLAAANVIAKQVNGADLFAQAVTDIQKEKDAPAMVRKIFEGFPGNVLKAEPIGDPRLISKTGTDAKIGVTVKFSVDMDKYTQWQAAFMPTLEKLAAKQEDRRWNPDKPDFVSLADGGEDQGFGIKDSDLGVSIPKEDLSHSYVFRNGPFDLATNCVAIFQRRGSTKVTILILDPDAFRQVALASYAFPTVEVRLKDAGGEELDGQESIASFRISSHFNGDDAAASPFWVNKSADNHYLSLGFPDDLDDPDWYPGKRNNRNGSFNWDAPRAGDVNAAIILPYCHKNDIALSGFTKEFVFTIPVDSLSKLKSVEVKISSRNNALTAHDDAGK